LVDDEDENDVIVASFRCHHRYELYNHHHHHDVIIIIIISEQNIFNRAEGRLKILILVNLEINRQKIQTMYINYQRQHMSFRSRGRQSYLKRSVQLRSSLQLLQVQPVV